MNVKELSIKNQSPLARAEVDAFKIQEKEYNYVKKNKQTKKQITATTNYVECLINKNQLSYNFRL